MQISKLLHIEGFLRDQDVKDSERVKARWELYKKLKSFTDLSDEQIFQEITARRNRRKKEKTRQ